MSVEQLKVLIDKFYGNLNRDSQDIRDDLYELVDHIKNLIEILEEF